MDGVPPPGFERPRTTWTPSMDRYFIDLVLDHVRQGNMIDYAFRKQVWTQMNTLFNQKFGFNYEKDVLKNRYKSLRRKYNEVTSILSNSGFYWDGKRQMVIADDKVWEDYIKVHPDKRSYRTKVLPYYSDLCMIYGNTPADGTYNHMGQDVGLNDDSSRTNSADALGDLPSPCMSIALGDPVDDPHLGEDMAQKSTDEGMENTLLEVAETELEKKVDDGLFPVEVIFAVDAAPSMLPTADANCSRVSWTPSMDRYFIDLMLDHMLKGNKIGQSFNEEAWMHLASLFSEKFGSQYDKGVLISRFKTLRKEYILVKNLLDHNGFHWDEKLQMVTADAHVWDTYTKAHPEARQYRVRPVPHFGDLCVIYGGTSVDGTEDHVDHSGNLKNGIQVTVNGLMSQGLCSPSTPFALRDPFSNEQEDSSHLVADMELSNHPNKRLFTVPSACENLKKPRQGTDGMMDAIHKMATAVTSLADIKKEDTSSTSIVSVVGALQAVPDIDEDLLLDACDYLEDEKKAKTFLALDVRLRKKWLMRKLRPVA